MLPKKRRILRKEFDYILKNGKRHNSPTLSFVVAPIPGETKKESKFSFSVSKKICPKAVDRNKNRRRGYSVVSKFLTQIKPDFYCFFIFKKTPALASFDELEKNIKELLSISGVLI